MQQDVLSGASVKLLANGNPIGFATSISFSRNFGIKQIYEIDNPYPVETAPTGPYSVQGQISGLQLRSTKGFDGIGLTNGGSTQAMILQKYCTIEIVDRSSGITIAKINDVLFTQDSMNIDARGVITISASFVGKFLSNVTT